MGSYNQQTRVYKSSAVHLKVDNRDTTVSPVCVTEFNPILMSKSKLQQNFGVTAHVLCSNWLERNIHEI
jgi:hypothetical protein